MQYIFDMVIHDLNEISHELKLTNPPILEINKSNVDAHFSTSLALINARQHHTSPHALAQKIQTKLATHPYYEHVEIAGPGFINIKIKPTYFTNVIANVRRLKTKYGHSQLKNKIINIEYVSANPTGFLHVGQARNAVVGSVLQKLLQADGYQVQTEYYVNDAGNQINILAITVLVHYLWLFNIEVKKPENCYVGTFYDDVAIAIKNQHGKQFIHATFDETKIIDAQVNDIFKETATQYFLDQIQNQLQQIGVVIETYSSEKAMYETGAIKLLLNQLEQQDATYQQDGALWLKSSKYGDDKDRVLVKSDQTLTYLVPDLAMHNVRIQRSKANTLINVFGGDHHGYIARMRAGLQLLGYDPNILEVEIVQMVRVIKDGQEFKMSKRKGTAIWLLDILEMIGKDALRYMLASKSSSSHMDLDIDVVQQKNATNPVYYAQYATARCYSILKQAQQHKIKPSFVQNDLLIHEKELKLLLTVDSFNHVIVSAAKNRSTSLICDFIQNVVKQFHSYYTDNKIIDGENIPLSQARLGLVAAVLQVLSNAFAIIGIETIEKM